MSVNDSISKDDYGLTVNISEELIESIIARGKKPKEILSNFLKRISSDINIEEIINYSEGKDRKLINKIKKEKEKLPKISYHNKNWSYSFFEDYMERLLNQAKRRADIADLLSMLIAYADTSSRPNSEDLREARGFGPGELWFEELRTTKARLTIFAKHLGLPSFFLRAYGSGMDRKHPIDEKVYGFLLEWVSSNEEIADQYRKVATPRSTE